MMDKQIEENRRKISDRQIEEMAIVINHGRKMGDAPMSIASDLYIAGYRKASEVAREISQDIIEPLWNAYKNSTCQETVLLVALICETINNQLKKKYESEGEG